MKHSFFFRPPWEEASTRSTYYDHKEWTRSRSIGPIVLALLTRVLSLTLVPFFGGSNE